jgi:hypothetical protein
MTWQPRRRALPRGWRPRRAAGRFRFPFWAGWLTVAAAAGVLYLVKGPILRTSMAQRAAPQCWYNAYDCTDFRTRAEAQAVFRACGGRRNDVHHLDRDGDGLACEWLR